MLGRWTTYRDSWQRHQEFHRYEKGWPWGAQPSLCGTSRKDCLLRTERSPGRFRYCNVIFYPTYNRFALLYFVGRNVHVESEAPGARQAPAVHPVRRCARPRIALHGPRLGSPRPHTGQGLRPRRRARSSGHVPVQVHL